MPQKQFKGQCVIIMFYDNAGSTFNVAPKEAKAWLDKEPKWKVSEYAKSVKIPPELVRNPATELRAHVTHSTWQNDKMLAVSAGESFDTLTEALRYIEEQKLEVIADYLGLVY